MLAGFGLGTLALSLTRPVPEVTLLPPPEATAQAEADPDPAPGPARPWPDAFGTRVAAAPEEPDPAPPPPPPAAPEPAAPAYTLRGTVTDGAGGWVLADGPEGIELVRLGSRLSGGERVVDITAEGVLLERNGRLYDIVFDPETTTGTDTDASHDGASHTPPWEDSQVRLNASPALEDDWGEEDDWGDEEDWDDWDDEDDWDDDFDDDDFDDDFDDASAPSWMDVLDARENRSDEHLMNEF